MCGHRARSAATPRCLATYARVALELVSTILKLLRYRSARDSSALIQSKSALLASVGARISMKSGRGRLSSTNSLTEKILRNCPCEYAAWSPSCQSPTCQSPAVIRPSPISNQSHDTLRLARSARNQRIGCLFAVENIDLGGRKPINVVEIDEADQRAVALVLDRYHDARARPGGLVASALSDCRHL